MTTQGAQSAYRGYRLQALYVLDRILDSEAEPSWSFRPEGMEDLDVLEEDHCIESIQVKSYAALVLSDLSPHKETSFLRRILRHKDIEEKPLIRLVNFGAFGPEMREAWHGKQQQRTQIVNKLEGHGFSASAIEFILEQVQIEPLDESEIKARVYRQLQSQLTGIDQDAAFDLLIFWLYKRAEDHSVITRSQLIDKIAAVGQFLAERHAHHEEWYTAIVPLMTDQPISAEQRRRLEADFREGVDASFMHILAGVDFRRDDKLEQISSAFHSSEVVVVHGPSGQGKTTLGYRYMYDYYPETWRFVVLAIENRQHALRIARALAGHARAVNTPMAIYIDVSPQDNEWPELVKQLVMLDQFHILVTIRDEDLKRANISGAAFRYTEIELTLDESEARLLYERAKDAFQITDFITFDDAWARFGASGPLMEFVYLLSHTRTLRERLRQQVNRIRDAVRMGVSSDEFRLLRLVAVASVSGARIDLALLRKALALPDLDRAIQLYEDEYLVRLSPDKRYVSGVHPIRSRILVDLLTYSHTEPWTEAMDDALPLIVEEDLESFLFHILVAKPAEATHIVHSIRRLEPRTWSGMAAIGRTLLWLGVMEYVNSIGPVLDEAHAEFGPAFTIAVDSDLMELLDPSSSEWWETIGTLMPRERKHKIRVIRAKQAPKAMAFETFSSWITACTIQPVSPRSSQDWAGAAFLLFWSGRLGLEPGLDRLLPTNALAGASSSLTISQLADLSAALFCCNAQRHGTWINSEIKDLEARLAHECGIVLIEQNCSTLTIHFISSLEEDASDELAATSEVRDRLHDETMERIRVVRRIFPANEQYGSHGYGHRFRSIGTPFYDSTEKIGIPASMIPLEWAVQPNAWFNGLSLLRYRPATWPEHARAIVELRGRICSCLAMILARVTRFHRVGRPFDLFSRDPDAVLWETCVREAQEPPPLPQCAVDNWGYTHEGLSREAMGQLNQQIRLHNYPLYLQRFSNYRNATREYMNAIWGFLWQARHVALINATVGKMRETDPRREPLVSKLREAGVKPGLGRMSTLNLSQALVTLNTYQRQIRLFFNDYFSSDELDTLECREHKLLSKLWPSWYFFAFQPAAPWADPGRQTIAKVKNEKKRIETRLASACRNLDGARAVVIDNMPAWGHEPTLWLRLELSRATDLYAKVEELLSALRDAIGRPDYHSLTHYVVEQNWKYIAIVPVVRGRMVDRLAWKLYVETTIVQQADPQVYVWSYVPQILPDSLVDMLGIPLWQSESITLAERLHSGVITGLLLLERLSDLARIPEASESGMEVLHSYFGSQAQTFSKAMQPAYDAGAAMFDIFNSLTVAEREERPSLSEAMAGLAELYPLIVPDGSSGESGSYTFDLDQIAAFAAKLSEAGNLASGVKLFWLDDAIDQIVDSIETGKEIGR